MCMYTVYKCTVRIEILDEPDDLAKGAARVMICKGYGELSEPTLGNWTECEGV